MEAKTTKSRGADLTPANGWATAGKLGGWVDEVFGEGFREIGGAFADSMSGFRARNRVRILEKTRMEIDKAGLTGQTRPISERLSGPILDAICDESDETLQDVWASYIRSTVDPSHPPANKVLIDVIRKLEPQDWPILKNLFVLPPGRYGVDDLGGDAAVLAEAMDRFVSLGLFQSGRILKDVLTLGDGLPTVVVDDLSYFEERLLRKLAEATRTQWSHSD